MINRPCKIILIDKNSYCYNRLNLPGKIEENDASTGSYDCEKGDFSMRFSKINKGEHFENLDMISSLLLPSTQKQVQIPNIEVISMYDLFCFSAIDNY